MRREFVSYPKSGRSWIRYLLTQLGHVNSVRFHHDGFEFNSSTRPPHDFDFAARFHRYEQVDKLVYLDRDPRDVIVSLFFQITGRFQDFFDFRGTLADFVRDSYFGAYNLKRFREMWRELSIQQSFLVISYEACHADPRAVLQRLLDYYELVSPSDEVEKAVVSSQFGKMKALEQSGNFPQPWLQLRNESAKVRRGKVGGFRDYLDPESLSYLNDLFGYRS